MNVTGDECGFEAADQSCRQDQIANPEGRKHYLGERSDVYGSVTLVKYGQRIESATAVTKFTVVVIFDNPGVGAPRPVDELQSALQSHGCTGGELVGGGDEDCLWRRFHVGKLTCPNSLAVYW